MKKNAATCLLIFASLLSLISCGDKFGNGNNSEDNAVYFSTEAFDDFGWKKQPPVEIDAVINTEFDECENISRPLILQLCDDDAKAVPVSVAQVYVDGEKSDDNTIKVDPRTSTGQTKIKIVLDNSQIHKTKTFTWYLKMLKNPGLEAINDRSSVNDPWILGTTLYWKNKHVANSLKVTTELGLVIVIIIAILIIIASRMSHEPFRIRKIYWEDTESMTHSILVRGASKVVFTNQKKKQSVFSRLLNRKIIYVNNDFFADGDIALTPGRYLGEKGVKFRAAIAYNLQKIFIPKGDSNRISNSKKQEININI